MSSQPVLVIVPGSFAPVSLYTSFTTLLQQHAFDVRVIDTPTVGRPRDPDAPAATMSDDAAEIARVVTAILDDEDRDVVLMPHSYGGVPTTQSMRTLSRANRPEAGRRAVEKIVYLTAVILPVNVDNMSLSGGKLPDWVQIDV
jgi:pimeloyl-ACP methyl ester carboxylesterase